MTHSAIYQGAIRHRRFAVRPREFRHQIAMAYIDLEELPRLLGGRLVAARPGLVRFRRRDYLGDPALPLARAVRELVLERTGRAPQGPIRLLTHLRTFGHCFNPVSFHFCFGADGKRPEAVLADVSNTPWGESHAYVIGSTPGEGRMISGRIEKQFHVSPLMGMDHVYEWRTSVPDERLQVQIESHHEGRLAFDATLALKRRELDPATAKQMLRRYPAMTAQVVAKIYWQALRLRLKGAPWFPHPERSR